MSNMTKSQKNHAFKLYDLVVDSLGGQTELAKAIGIKPPALTNMKHRGYIAHARVAKIVEIGTTNGIAISKNDLRPDIWE